MRTWECKSSCSDWENSLHQKNSLKQPASKAAEITTVVFSLILVCAVHFINALFVCTFPNSGEQKLKLQHTI